MVKVMYTFEPCDPFKDESKQRYNYYMHQLLLSTLSDKGVNSLNIAILGVARDIISLFPMTEIKFKKYEDEFNKVFIGKEVTAKFDVDPNNSMTLIERINDVDPNYYRPVDGWQIDTDLTKAMLIRKLDIVPFNQSDLGFIYEFYGLNDYSLPVWKSGVENTRTQDYIDRYYNYVYEFYRRSDNPDIVKMEYYKYESSTTIVHDIFNISPDQFNDKFTMQVDLFGTLDQKYLEIDDICSSIKFYVQRMHELNYPQTRLFNSKNKGNKHYLKKFELWDRYLRIYDLYKQYEDDGKVINDGILNAIGRKIAKEFNFYAKSESSERRKELVKGYKEALRLIKQSTEGNLL